MKNPANRGDFGTNRTRGVVMSGMSETTISADWPIGISVSITQTCGRPATEFEMLTYAWYALGAKMRAAEGGAGRETTNSASEIEAACTGRKWALLTVTFAVMAVCMSLLVSDLGLALGLLAFSWSFASGYLLGKFWIIPALDAWRSARLRASGEGIR